LKPIELEFAEKDNKESNDIKENSNCKESEKQGEGPGSCGGSKITNENKTPKKLKSSSKLSSEEFSNAEHKKLLTPKASSAKFNKEQSNKLNDLFNKYDKYKQMFDVHSKMGIVSRKEFKEAMHLIESADVINKELSKELKFKVSNVNYEKISREYLDKVEIIEYGMSDPGKNPEIGPLDRRRILTVAHDKDGYKPVIDQYHKFLEDKDDYKEAIRHYVHENPFSPSDSLYKNVNLLLSGKEPKNSEKSKKLISDLDSMFDNAPPTPVDMVVWRGGTDGDKKRMLDAGNGDFNNLIGHVKEQKAYTSCTMSERIADAFASKNFFAGPSANGLIYEITIPKGSRAIATSNVGSELDEAEILVDRGANILITGVEDLGTNGKFKIKGILVSHGGK